MGLALTDLKAELVLFFSGFSPHMVKTRELSSKQKAAQLWENGTTKSDL